MSVEIHKHFDVATVISSSEVLHLPDFFSQCQGDDEFRVSGRTPAQVFLFAHSFKRQKTPPNNF
jgi:hypothetical protein